MDDAVLLYFAQFALSSFNNLSHSTRYTLKSNSLQMADTQRSTHMNPNPQMEINVQFNGFLYAILKAEATPAIVE